MKGLKSCPLCKGSGYATCVVHTDLIRLPRRDDVNLSESDPVKTQKAKEPRRFVIIHCELADHQKPHAIKNAT